MAVNKDLEYWRARTKQFGKASIGYGCKSRFIYWDNFLRSRAISRLCPVRPGMNILDVGTGTGYWAIKFARCGAKVTALDFNADILEIAQTEARKANVEIRWMLGALEEAQLPPASFDAALSITCLQHITERGRQEEAVRRILRSLKPGGVFVLLEDTVDCEPKEDGYLLTYPQKEWIGLVESQGSRLIDFTGVSFVRFQFRQLPVLFSVGTDLILGHLPWVRHRAKVTAFAFAKVYDCIQSSTT
jgi:SAM-dependent methyltransferase